MSPKFIDLPGETEPLSAIKSFDKNKTRLLFSLTFGKHVSATFNSSFFSSTLIELQRPLLILCVVNIS